MRQYLLDLKAQGKTILIALHSAEDIDVLCDMNGIGTGDIEYVRVTLKDIGVDGSVVAKLENVELLSDILAHAEDDTTGGVGMGI